MSDETRMILEKLGQIDENVQEMKADISGLKRDVEELRMDVLNLMSRILKFELSQRKFNSLVENDIAKKYLYEWKKTFLDFENVS